MTFSNGSSNKTIFVKNCFLSHFEQIIAFSTIIRVISKLSTITLKLARITHFSMIFCISSYLIITLLLNDAIRFCSKIPLSGDSNRTKICRARRSTGVYAIGVFTVWHYRTDNRFKILVLFNLFFFCSFLTSFNYLY